MQKKIVRILVAFFVIAGVVSPKDCPSKLANNLHSYKDISYGVEVRFWDYYVNRYDYLEDVRRDDNYLFLSLDGLVQYEISDNLFSSLEVLFRGKRFSRRYFECRYASSRPRVNVKQLWIEYMSDFFVLHAGRDVLAYGNQMVLDNFFDQVVLEFDFDALTLRFGGGVLARQVAREALACQKGIVYEYHQCWKKFCEADWGDHKMGFMELSYSLFPKNYQKFLFLYTKSIYEDQNSLIFDLFMNGRLWFKVNYFVEMAVQRFMDTGASYIGSSFIFYKYLPMAIARQQLKAGLLIAERDDNGRFAPLFESLWLGERYRYSLYQGNIFFVEDKIKIGGLENLSFNVQYSYKFSGLVSDELDLGTTLSFTDRYRFFIVYSILNLHGDYKVTHQVKINARIIL